MKKYILSLFIILIGYNVKVKSQVMNYLIPFNTQANNLRSLNYPNGIASDSLIVTSGITRWMSRRPAYTAGTGIVISIDNVISSSGKRRETYSGTTNSSGIYSVVYSTAYSVAPNIQFNIGIGGNNKETILLTSSTTTGFTVYVQLRSDVIGLLPTYSNVNSRNVDVLVSEK